MPLLAIKNLTVTYPNGVKALDNASFSVHQGQITGIVGESGSGKSTLAQALMGILPPDARQNGTMIIDGRDCSRLSSAQWQAIRGRVSALIMQDAGPALDPVFTIGWQFAELMKYCGGVTGSAAQERIKTALARAHVQDAARVLASYPHQLSGGQLQRVCIAMALACESKIIIADEPTSSLDVTIENQIVHLFKELNTQMGITIVFITHNLDIVRVLCHQVVVLHKGVVREINDTASLFTAPCDEYTKSLLHALKEMRG